MKLIAFLLLLPLLSFSQDFEGYIEYKISYKVNTKNISLKTLEKNFGTVCRTYIKNGFYKEITNSELYSLQLFRHNNSKVYFKHEIDDTLRITSIQNKNQNQKFEFQITKNAALVLGVKCDKLVVKDNLGTKTYYYSSKYSLDPKFYNGFTASNKDQILNLIKSIYLKLDMEYSYYNVYIEATKIQREKLKLNCFQIPKSKYSKYEN